MSGLLENTKRSSFKITESGKKFLTDNPKEINLKVLKTVPAFLERTGRLKDEDVFIDIEEFPLLLFS